MHITFIYKQWDQCFRIPLKCPYFKGCYFFLSAWPRMTVWVFMCWYNTPWPVSHPPLSSQPSHVWHQPEKSINRSMDQSINNALCISFNQCFLYKLFMNWCHKCMASPEVIRLQMSNKWSIFNIAAWFTHLVTQKHDHYILLSEFMNLCEPGLRKENNWQQLYCKFTGNYHNFRCRT